MTAAQLQQLKELASAAVASLPSFSVNGRSEFYYSGTDNEISAFDMLAAVETSRQLIIQLNDVIQHLEGRKSRGKK